VNGILQKRVVSTAVDPTLPLCLYRSALALPLLCLSARWLEPSAPLLPPRQHWPLIAVYSATAIVGEQTLHLLGLRFGDSYVLGVLAQNSVPVFACLIASLLGTERLTPAKAAGVLVSVAGTLLMFIPVGAGAAPPPPRPPARPSPRGHKNYALGCVCLLLASLAWAASLFAQKPLLVALRAPITLTMWAVALAALLSGLIAAAALVAGGAPAASFAVDAQEARFLAFGATLGCAVKYCLASVINAHCEAVLNTVLDAAGHAVAVVVGAWALQEPLYPRYAASLLVLAGGAVVSHASDWGGGADVAALAPLEALDETSSSVALPLLSPDDCCVDETQMRE